MKSTDESWKSWLCDLEPEDCNFINEIDITPLQRSFSNASHCSHTTSSIMSNSSSDVVNSFERPSKTLKTNPSNTGYPSSQKKKSSHSYILYFNNEKPEPEPELEPILINIDSTLKPKGKILKQGKSLTTKGSLEDKKKEPKRNIQESKKTDSVTKHAKDHILAERKRREKISQQFIALSALIPNLKKMDKASILGEAVNHVKQLQEKVKVLEEQNQKKNVESEKTKTKTKSCCLEEDVSDTSSNSGNGNCSKTNGSVPEIEARVSEKNVMIRIHCENRKGVLMNTMKEIENLHLSVTSSSALLFGTTKLDITIIAEGMEDLAFFHQYPMDYVTSPIFDNFDFLQFDNCETISNCFADVETKTNDDYYVDQTRPTKKIKTTTINSNSCPSPPQLISFEHFNATPIASHVKVEKRCNPNKDFATFDLASQGSYEDHKLFSNCNDNNNRANQTRNTIQAQEHVIAERKRREKLTRSFIALSAIVPGLKKMDKASVLGDAIKYMKQLQTRLEKLEEEAEDNKKTGSTMMKRSIIFNDDDENSNSNSNNSSFPEIEVRVSSKDVLIKIQCNKHNGSAKLHSLLENLNLNVQSSTILPFGNNIIDLTIVAQMKKEKCVNAKDLLRSIRETLLVQN